MPRQKKTSGCCPPVRRGCKVESIINIDERGQMVLSKELRVKAGINAGDKLAVVSWEKDGKICCITLIKADELVGMVKDAIGPVVSEIFDGQEKRP